MLFFSPFHTIPVILLSNSLGPVCDRRQKKKKKQFLLNESKQGKTNNHKKNISFRILNWRKRKYQEYETVAQKQQQYEFNKKNEKKKKKNQQQKIKS